MKPEAKFLSEEEQRQALALARRSLEERLIKGGEVDARSAGVDTGGIFGQDRAVFVTLKVGGRLRGCIGHITPSEPLWKSISGNAIAAAIHDGRFSPVDGDELLNIDIEVSVLTPPEPIESVEQFEAGRHGIIMGFDGHRAVFLPQVASEHGWDREKTLRYLSLKAGLPEDGWTQPGVKFHLFEAQVFAEE